MGAMIHYLETPPFIVTLAGMFLARGGCYHPHPPNPCRSTTRPSTR